jgi:hypothetical protein
MRIFLSVLLIAACAGVSLDAQGKKGGRKKNAAKGGANPEGAVVLDLQPAQIAGEIPAERASDPGRQSDWPAIAHTSDGALWTAFVEWNDRNADRIVVRRRDPKGAWGARRNR